MLVEFAAIFVVFVTLVWGIISYGIVFGVQQSLEHAADEATRVGFGQNDAAVIEAGAVAIVNDQLSWLGAAGAFDRATGDVAEVRPCPYQLDGATPDCLVVELTFDWANDAIVPALFDVGIPDVLTATATVTVNP